MRRRSREIALQVLFQTEFGSPTDHHFNPYEKDDQDSMEYAKYLVEGVQRNLETLDKDIETFSRNWKLSRMALVDRNILRLATFEVMFAEDLSTATIINEAIELSKKYGQKESGGFINGVLDQIARQRRAIS